MRYSRGLLWSAILFLMCWCGEQTCGNKPTKSRPLSLYSNTQIVTQRTIPTSVFCSHSYSDFPFKYKSYCSTVHCRRITSIYRPTNAYIISHKTRLKHFKTLRHVWILSDHHQGALFLAKFILRYSQFNSYLQTRCCGSISCCVVEQWLGVRRTTHT